MFVNTLMSIYFYSSVHNYRNFIRNKYLQYSYFYLVFIYITAFKLYTSNYSYYVCSKFVSFLKIMQKHLIYLNMLLLWWSHIFIFMPRQWCFPVFNTFYCGYPEHICTKYSIFDYVR